MQEAAGLECPPPCLVCHVLPEGGKNWTKFGLRVMPFSIEKKPWPDVLTQLRAADVDSDGDGRNDIFEIDHGTNPSQTGEDTITCVKYGCGAHVAPRKSADPLAAWLALGSVIGAVYLRRRDRFSAS